MVLLQTTNLTKRFDKQFAIHNVNFSIKEKTCVALIGPNGAGKTTILKMLAGLIKPTSGAVTFEGSTADMDIRSKIGYLPQYPHFPSWMSGKEFLIFSGQLAHLSKSTSKKRATELLEKLELSNASNKRIHTYSGGMKQRLGIAQAIIHKPKLLLLDEPVSSLDPIGRRYILTLMEELKKNMSILYSTHILSDVEEVSDELLLLRQGEIIESGPMETIKDTYKTTKMELEFKGDSSFFKEQLSELSSVASCVIKQQKLIVTASDIALARQEILAKVHHENWELVEFAINRASLEDMFMKVVKQ